MVKIFVTGGAGFIGSVLVEKLLAEGDEVTVYDNLSSGKEELIKQHFSNPRFEFIKGDTLDLDKLKKTVKGHDLVFHLAANPDIAKGAIQTDLDLKEGAIATYNVLEAMRVNGVRKIVFTSSSAVYGDQEHAVTSESFGPLLPISFYGAGKLAGEALVSAFCNMYDVQGWIFRFANITGRNSTHGVTFDFIKKLRKDQKELEILGDGTQSKSYIYVDDCVDAMLFIMKKSNEKINLYNICSEDFIDVKSIADIIVKQIGLKDVKYRFTGGRGGWKGDVPKVRMDGTKLKKLGWTPKLTSKGAIEKTVSWILSNT